MKRVLMVQPDMRPSGGGTGVSAWILQALAEEHEVTVLTMWPFDVEQINQYHGTRLRASDFTHLTAYRWAGRWLERVPVTTSLLRFHLMLRAARKIRQRYHAVITYNEGFVGAPTLQYVHFPWRYLPRPDAPACWHQNPVLRGVLWAYYALCTRLSSDSLEGVRRNLTLTNSAWTAEKYRQCYGVLPQPVYPPIVHAFPDVPWEAREQGFVCIGRFAPEKNLDRVIAVVAGLRERGHTLRLHLIGSKDANDRSNYLHYVREQATRHGDWISLHVNPSRAELGEIVAAQRFGIHAMVDEHFGMAVAEMLVAGCVPFAHRSGGTVEILGHEESLLYNDVDEAIDKIDTLLRNQEELHRVRAGLQARRGEFSAERFVHEIQQAVRLLSQQ